MTKGSRACGCATFRPTAILRSCLPSRCNTWACGSLPMETTSTLSAGSQGQSLKYLYRAPVLGGTPQKLVTDVDTNITFSPDGRSLAYVVLNNPELGKFRLVTYSLDTGEGKTLVTGNMNQRSWRSRLVAGRQDHRVRRSSNQEMPSAA